MGKEKQSYPMCQVDTDIDYGTTNLQKTFPPGPVRLSHASSYDLETELHLLETEALNFGYRFIHDASIRSDYTTKVSQMARALRQEVLAGNLAPYEAAQEANKLRNAIMDAARISSSDIGRANAEALKATGKTLSELEEYYAKKVFNRSFSELDEAAKNRVWGEIVEASGRSNKSVSFRTARLEKLGRGLVFISVAVAVYNISTAEDKTRQTVKEVSVAGGGVLGGMAGGAIAGMACGPGAPVCVTVGVFIGGAAVAIGVDLAFDAWW